MLIRPAPMNLTIKLTTALVFAIDATLYWIALAAHWPLIFAAGFVTLTILICYLTWVPIGYEIDGQNLRIRFRLLSITYGPIKKLEPLRMNMWGAIGLFRNGGLFAVSGIFYKSPLGTFRAYLTTTDQSKILFLQAGKHKILISPEAPAAVQKLLPAPIPAPTVTQ